MGSAPGHSLRRSVRQDLLPRRSGGTSTAGTRPSLELDGTAGIRSTLDRHLPSAPNCGMATDDPLRQQLVEHLEARGAHLPFEAAVRDFPGDAINRRAPELPYTPWHLVEHIRFAQADILDYIVNHAYLAPDWPDEYW